MEKKSSSAPVDTPLPVATPEAQSSAPAVTQEPVERPIENTIHVEGVLDIDLQRGGNGQLLDLSRGGKRRPTDTFVPKELIRRFKLRTGNMIGGTAFPPDGRFLNPKMRFIETVDGVPLEERRARFEFTPSPRFRPISFLKWNSRTAA
jgi:transcription termination factor Rho